MTDPDRVVEIIEAFIEKHGIASPDDLYEVDDAVMGLVEILCDEIGYAPSVDEDEDEDEDSLIDEY